MDYRHTRIRTYHNEDNIIFVEGGKVGNWLKAGGDFNQLYPCREIVFGHIGVIGR
jgi:hypothetical protein